MVMYATAVTQLIHQLKQETKKQVWFADDATAGGNLTNLHEWWDRLTSTGPDYGYFLNPSKTWLIVKEGYEEKAESTFRGTQVVISEEGKKYFGSAIGKQTFIENYVQQKVTTWVSELERLSSIAISQPHAVFAAFVAFTHGLTNRWTYLARTTPNIVELIKPLEETIRKVLLPNLTGQNQRHQKEFIGITSVSRWSQCLGGLCILDPCKKSAIHYSTCQKISAPLYA